MVKIKKKKRKCIVCKTADLYPYAKKYCRACASSVFREQLKQISREKLQRYKQIPEAKRLELMNEITKNILASDDDVSLVKELDKRRDNRRIIQESKW